MVSDPPVPQPQYCRGRRPERLEPQSVSESSRPSSSRVSEHLAHPTSSPPKICPPRPHNRNLASVGLAATSDSRLPGLPASRILFKTIKSKSSLKGPDDGCAPLRPDLAALHPLHPATEPALIEQLPPLLLLAHPSLGIKSRSRRSWSGGE